MIHTNAHGARAAARFRRRFGLPPIGATYDRYGVSGDAHDYLHTVCGAWPGPIDDEVRVLALEEAIDTGRVPLPRGLDRT